MSAPSCRIRNSSTQEFELHCFILYNNYANTYRKKSHKMTTLKSKSQRSWGAAEIPSACVLLIHAQPYQEPQCLTPTGMASLSPGENQRNSKEFSWSIYPCWGTVDCLLKSVCAAYNNCSLLTQHQCVISRMSYDAVGVFPSECKTHLIFILFVGLYISSFPYSPVRKIQHHAGMTSPLVCCETAISIT